MMNRTFGAPAFARSGAGQAGVDSAIVRPRIPGKAVPGLYSRNAIDSLPYEDCSITSVPRRNERLLFRGCLEHCGGFKFPVEERLHQSALYAGSKRYSPDDGLVMMITLAAHRATLVRACNVRRVR